MTSTLESFDFINFSIPIVDVRSPAEFLQGHIPNAFNIPIFDNEERAIIGTLYKQLGKEKAVESGLEIVGPKMAFFVSESKKIAIDKQIHVHCWRGGMRSSSFSWLLQTASLQPKLLKGGYKSYRNFVLNYLKNIQLKVIILGGNTGSGKTYILSKLTKLNQQVIDLENLANHKGSVFGSLGQLPQPTNEQFENNLVHQLMKFDHSKPIWIEAESRLIGNISIPLGLWNNMKNGFRINIEIPILHRAARLAQEYGLMNIDDLIICIKKIEKRLGSQNANSAIEALLNNKITECAAICLTYYDKFYEENIKSWQNEKISFLKIETPESIDYQELIIKSKKIYGNS